MAQPSGDKSTSRSAGNVDAQPSASANPREDAYVNRHGYAHTRTRRSDNPARHNRESWRPQVANDVSRCGVGVGGAIYPFVLFVLFVPFVHSGQIEAIRRHVDSS